MKKKIKLKKKKRGEGFDSEPVDRSCWFSSFPPFFDFWFFLIETISLQLRFCFFFVAIFRFWMVFFFFPFRREEGKFVGSGECWESDEREFLRMFKGSKEGRTMKWVTLLKDFKEKVGITQSSPPPLAPPSSAQPSSSSRENNAFSASQVSSSSPTRFLFIHLYLLYFLLLSLRFSIFVSLYELFVHFVMWFCLSWMIWVCIGFNLRERGV